MNSIFVTKNEEETKHLAQDLASQLKGEDVLLLYGDLGYGKTTFVQGLAKGLGVKKRIISPTFIFVRTYELINKNAKRFYHIDLYRAQTQGDLESLGLKEILQDSEAIVVIEWPEKLGNLIPNKRMAIYFNYISDGEREITIKDERN